MADGEVEERVGARRKSGCFISGSSDPDAKAFPRGRKYSDRHDVLTWRQRTHMFPICRQPNHTQKTSQRGSTYPHILQMLSRQSSQT